MGLRFVYDPRAEKELRAVPAADRVRIARRVEAYAADPGAAHHDARRLTNFDPAWRLRIGDWRVLFDLEGDMMLVRRVLHRREAYR